MGQVEAKLEPLVERPQAVGLHRVASHVLRPELGRGGGDKISVQLVNYIRDDFFHRKHLQTR